MVPNTYSAAQYNQFGIYTYYHFFSKDEFMYMGKNISREQADQIAKIGENVLCSLNSGYDNKDRIGTTENAFIRAFNYQLKLQMGPEFIWNGGPGLDCRLYYFN